MMHVQNLRPIGNLLQLDRYVGLNISQICANYNDNAMNHCAHFVSHVLMLSGGTTCWTVSHIHTTPPAAIKVHQLFPLCQNVGEWIAKPPSMTTCLIFAVMSGKGHINYATKEIKNIGNKHVGIFTNDSVYHYSNDLGKCVVKHTMEQFDAHVTLAYGRVTKAFGSLP